ncbi:sigma-70 family RNA polymerase sigma factor [soil metagenome]
MFLKLFSKSKPPPPDDHELVRQYRQTGDLELIGQLFERHTEMVYLVCRKYLREEEASKDATMHVFEKLVRTLRRFEVQNFKSWLYATAKNHCLMQLRAQKTNWEVPLAESGAAAMESAPGLHLSGEEGHEEEWQVLEQGLAHLPPEQRTCLELFYYQQKSYHEIAAQTGYDLGKVKSYLQNGRRNLKIYVEKHHEQP